MEEEVGGFFVHRFRRRDIRKSSKAVLVLPGGGGMERATLLHYDIAMKIAKDTGTDVYIAHYLLAPKYNVRYALDWLNKLYAVLLKKTLQVISHLLVTAQELILS